MIADERAVSDVLAFSLIFGVMIVSVGLIGMVGFDAIGGMSEQERLSSAEVSMTELADQLSGIADHEAPVRSTELRASGAEIELIDGPTLTVTVNASDRTVTETIDLGGVAYRTGDSAIVVVGGAVIRTEGDTGILLRAPPMLTLDDRARINVISASPRFGEDRHHSGVTLQLRTHHQRTSLVTPGANVSPAAIDRVHVAIEGDGPVADAYRAYFDAEWPTDPDGGWALTDLDAGAFVRISHVELQLIG